MLSREAQQLLVPSNSNRATFRERSPQCSKMNAPPQQPTQLPPAIPQPSLWSHRLPLRLCRPQLAHTVINNCMLMPAGIPSKATIRASRKTSHHTPATLLQHMAAPHTDSPIMIAMLCSEPNSPNGDPGKIKLFHHILLYTQAIGQDATPWDGNNYAIMGDMHCNFPVCRGSVQSHLPKDRKPSPLTRPLTSFW